MAKFAIAMFILLVASVTCDAQDSTSSNSVSIVVDMHLTLLQDVLQTMSDAYSNAKTTFENIIQEAKTNFETAITEWEAKLANVTAAYSDVSSCISSSTNLTETAKKVFNETITCAGGVFVDLFTQAGEVVNSTESLVNELKEIADEAAACPPTLLPVSACRAKIMAEKLPTIATKVTQAAANTASLALKFNNISTELQKCGILSAIKVIVTDGQKVIDETRTCLENLDSTSA